MKIVRSYSPSTWYLKHIGECFKVKGETLYDYHVEHEGRTKFIHKLDCEIVEEHKDMPPLSVTIGTRPTLGGHNVFFKIGVQSFSLAPVETEEEAAFYHKMLCIAFDNLIDATARNAAAQ